MGLAGFPSFGYGEWCCSECWYTRIWVPAVKLFFISHQLNRRQGWGLVLSLRMSAAWPLPQVSGFSVFTLWWGLPHPTMLALIGEGSCLYCCWPGCGCAGPTPWPVSSSSWGSPHAHGPCTPWLLHEVSFGFSPPYMGPSWLQLRLSEKLFLLCPPTTETARVSCYLTRHLSNFVLFIP